MKFQHFAVNITGKARIEILKGRKYRVLPIRILREGVLTGEGVREPVLYRLRDLKRFAASWNNKPIVVNHPKNHRGDYCSAAKPKHLEESEVGFLLRNRIAGQFHEAEAWIDEERIEEIAPEVLEMMDAGLTIGVSAGLFSDLRRKRGNWNGEDYKYIAENHRPDHCALLPRSIGACSIEDGCGVFTAAQAASPKKMKRVQEAISRAWKGKPLTNCSCEKGKLMKRKSKIRSLIANKIWSKKDQKMLEDVDDTTFKRILVQAERVQSVDSKIKSPRTPKSRSEADSERRGESRRPRREESHREDRSPHKRKKTEDAPKTRKKKKLRKSKVNVNMLRKRLKKRRRLEALQTLKRQEKAERKKFSKLPLKEQIRKALKSQPGPIRDILVNGLKAHGAERRRLIDVIISNEDAGFEKQELQDESRFPLNLLRKMANLAVQNSGEGDDLYSQLVGGTGSPLVNNRKDEDDQEVLAVPDFDDEDEAPKKGKKDNKDK